MACLPVTEIVTTRLGTGIALIHQFEKSGKIFTACFVKKDNTIRKMNCKIKHPKPSVGFGERKGLRFKPVEKGLLSVWDLQKGEYRFINLDTLIYIKFAGKLYIF